MRVPVVIYNGLTRAEECRLFIDINTKQRPVPNELLLDIKRLAETETDQEAVLRDVFDLFAKEPDSPLVGFLSQASKAKAKLSRVTFNAAVTPVLQVFESLDAPSVYGVLSAYLRVWMEHLQKESGEAWITNPTLFRAVLAIFQDIAQRVADRYGPEYTVQNFREVVSPLLARVKKGTLKTPGTSYVALSDTLKKSLRQQFTIAGP